MDIKFADVAELQTAYDGSWYFVAGAGGDLAEWVTGYEKLMAEQEIGKPAEWWQTNGSTINLFATRHKGTINRDDCFKGDLACLLFPLDGLHVGRLAIFKLQMEDRWFDDVIQNMRRA